MVKKIFYINGILVVPWWQRLVHAAASCHRGTVPGYGEGHPLTVHDGGPSRCQCTRCLSGSSLPVPGTSRNRRASAPAQIKYTFRKISCRCEKNRDINFLTLQKRIPRCTPWSPLGKFYRVTECKGRDSRDYVDGPCVTSIIFDKSPFNAIANFHRRYESRKGKRRGGDTRLSLIDFTGKTRRNICLIIRRQTRK